MGRLIACGRPISLEEREMEDGQVITMSFSSMQYLPLYTPSEEEKNNPALFANNVRSIMAKLVVCVCVWPPQVASFTSGYLCLILL